MKCSGQIISRGIAYGKARFLTAVDNVISVSNDSSQADTFFDAIAMVSSQLDSKILDAKSNYDERISGIFESHKLIVNDPILIKETLALIESGLNAKNAYQTAVEKILKTFAKIDNEYMLGRIVDIIDATDQVKSCITGKANQLSEKDENTIVVLKQLKPSVIYSFPIHQVKGFLSDLGFYTQHSGIIARKIEIPGMVCPGIYDKIKENDFVIIDSIDGEIHINPDNETRSRYIKEDF